MFARRLTIATILIGLTTITSGLGQWLHQHDDANNLHGTSLRNAHHVHDDNATEKDHHEHGQPTPDGGDSKHHCSICLTLAAAGGSWNIAPAGAFATGTLQLCGIVSPTHSDWHSVYSPRDHLIRGPPIA